MIERLKRKDILEAGHVYVKGLLMQIPKPGRKAKLEDKIKILKEEAICFVSKENGKINGLVSFEKRGNNLKMRFICSFKKRKGVGSALMKRLAVFASKNNVNYVHSRVSSKDKRVMSFYEKLGFLKYGEYKTDRGFMVYRIKTKPQQIIKNLDL